MTILFWSLTVLLAALAAAFVLRPLIGSGPRVSAEREQALADLYREKLKELDGQKARGDIEGEDYALAREELETALAVELSEPAAEAPAVSARKRLAWGVGAGVPAAALLLYALLGNLAGLQESGTGRTAEGQPSVQEMVARLEARLESNPDDVEGWQMLGRSYTVLEQPYKARYAYAEAAERAPENAEVLLDYAEAIARAQGNTLTGEPEQMIEKAVRLEPESKRGRWLLGIAAYQQGENETALAYWKDLAGEPGTTREEKELLQRFIAAASGESVAPEQPDATAQAAGGPASIEVTVSLDEALAAKASPSDTVFVYARAVQGPPMPLAIERHNVSSLPLPVTLDDGDAMMEQMKLSGFDKVMVVARVSKSGSAEAASGDLQGLSGTVNPNNTPRIELIIDQVVP